MTTLNARANQAYHDLISKYESDNTDHQWPGFDDDPHAFEEGWETGYKARDEEIRKAFDRITYASDDGTEFQHAHPEDEGEPECPACWAQHIRQILGGLS
jgi:hypothetical protein